MLLPLITSILEELVALSYTIEVHTADVSLSAAAMRDAARAPSKGAKVLRALGGAILNGLLVCGVVILVARAATYIYLLKGITYPRPARAPAGVGVV